MLSVQDVQSAFKKAGLPFSVTARSQKELAQTIGNALLEKFTLATKHLKEILVNEESNDAWLTVYVFDSSASAKTAVASPDASPFFEKKNPFPGIPGITTVVARRANVLVIGVPGPSALRLGRYGSPEEIRKANEGLPGWRSSVRKALATLS